jgi:uncharacterized protein YndB with AHSA1/START domain
MSEVHEEALIDAPVPAVWELVGDPRRYPEWLPRVLEVQGESFDEGDRFIQVTETTGRQDIHFIVDSRDELREIRMHCSVSGMFVHWQLTGAQGGTFVHAAFGMEPVRPRDHVLDRTIGKRFFRRWLVEAVEALRGAAAREGAA